MKNQPLFVTLTGLDERTDLARARLLSETYPLEWGVLFSPSRQGQEPRYPRLEVVDKITDLPILMAAHLCGQHAKNILNRQPVDVDLTNFERIQVNCIKPDYDAIAEFAESSFVQAITQHRETTFPPSGKLQLLYDCSGGRGTPAGEWPTHPGWFVGYAGGISPDNITQVLEEIDSTGEYWLDMESGVRTDDWLDLDKCEAVLAAIYDKKD